MQWCSCYSPTVQAEWYGCWVFEVTSVGAGLPLIALGVILVAVAAVLREREGDPVRSAGCRFRITAPKNGEKITNRGITVIQGTACSSDNIWIFYHSINGQDYYWENEETS